MRVADSGSAPVTTPSAPDTSPEKAWTDALAQAKANTPQQTVTVKSGDTLTSIANSHKDTLPRVEKANPQIANPNLIHPGETVKLPKAMPSQAVSGVANSQIKPIITAMANANAADRGLQNLEHSHLMNRAAISDAAAQSAQSWDSVQQATLTTLMNNNSGAYPELAASREVRQLNALEPGNAKFAAANNAALAQATQSWQQMGITKPQLSPIINAYNNAKGIAQDLQNPNAPHNMAITSDLHAAEQQANTQLNAAIEKSLTDAANQAGGNAAERSEAMTERAATLQMAGPQDAAFQTAVDNANYDLQVNKPAQAIANAYSKHGAEAAAQALKIATQGVGNPYYAGQIIRASQGTIDSIAKSMASRARQDISPEYAFEDTHFSTMYSDLSASVAAASTITASGSMSSGGVAATNIVADAIARNAPNVSDNNPLSAPGGTLYQADAYFFGARSAVANGSGVGLTLATAATMKQSGNSILATDMGQSAAAGIQSLQSKTSSDVKDFFTTTGPLDDLRSTWGPFMTQAQEANATNGYLHDHPDVQKKADAQLKTISQDGDAVAQAEAAWNSYRGQLSGIGEQGNLAAAAKSLTANNSSGFAISQSTAVNNAIAGALAHMPSGQGGGSVVQALAASPSPLQGFISSSPYIWGALRSGRSFGNAVAKTVHKSDNFNISISNETFTTLSFMGLLLTAQSAASKGLSFSSFQGAASSLYSGLGLTKYSIEVASGLSKMGAFKQVGVLSDLSSSMKVPRLDQAGNVIMKDGKAVMVDAPWWKALGASYYGVGALANYLEAVDAFKSGDNVAGGLDVASGVGATINAAAPFLVDLGVDEAVADWAGPVGAGIGFLAAVGTAIYDGVKGSQAQAAYQHDSSKFLQQGLGLKPDVADALSAPSGQPDGSSASAALQRYANGYHLPLGDILQKLNQEPIGKVKQFVNEAANMPKKSNGHYAASLPSDNPNQVGTHMVMQGGGRFARPMQVPYQADSLRQLKYWADYLFGASQMG